VLLSLSQTGPASVRVFDVAGRTVRTLLRGVQPAGERVLAWDGRDDAGSPLSAGVYLLRLDAGGHSETRSVRLVK
jgi:flagellar hook assembly protein FlgD